MRLLLDAHALIWWLGGDLADSTPVVTYDAAFTAYGVATIW